MTSQNPNPLNATPETHERTVCLGDLTFQFLTANPPSDADPAQMLAGFHHAARGPRSALLDQHVFAQHADIPKCLEQVTQAQSGDVNEPIVWLTGHAMPTGRLTGGKAWVVPNCDSTPLEIEGCRIGHVFSDSFARYCLLTNLIPQDLSASRTKQAQSVFDRMVEILESIGMDFSHVVRTWLYLDRILEWYDDFNVVRNNIFEQHGVYDGLLPASTGVGAANPQGAALVANLLAIQPKRSDLQVQAIPSPLQCPAPDYKSSFSRAIEIAAPNAHMIMVSGTASIAPGGQTVHCGDMPGQIELTMDVTRAILVSRGMDWQHVVRGVAYFKDIEQIPMFKAWLEKHQLPNLPLTQAHCDVCRDDLLFEVELDAASHR